MTIRRRGCMTLATMVGVHDDPITLEQHMAPLRFAVWVPVLLMLSHQPTQAQVPDTLRAFHDQVVFSQLVKEMSGVVHPVAMALAEWRALGLTESQVRELQDLEDEFGRILFKFLEERDQELVSPSMWWDAEPVSELEIRTLVERKVEQEVAVMLALIELRDQVFGLLSEDQRDFLRDKVGDQVGSLRRGAMSSVTPHPCVSGSLSGGSRLSPTVELLYVLSFEADSAHVDVLFVARADDRIRSIGGLPPRPEVPTGRLSGGTAGNWYLQFDRETRTAWVDDQPVDVGDDVVVLVQGIDRLLEPPDVVGTVDIPRTFYTGGCADGRWAHEHLRGYVLQFPEIQDFIGG